MGFAVLILGLYLGAFAVLWHLWIERRHTCAPDGVGLVSMSSSLGGDGGGSSSGGRPPLDEVRSRIASPWMQQRIRRWLHALTIPAPQLEDVAQDVTAAALQSAHTFDPARASLERWVNRISVNVAADWHERVRTRQEELLAEPPEMAAEEMPPDLALVAEQNRLSMLAALQLVPLDLRAIIVAHDLDGIPMSEVAERYRLPLSTAYKWRARGLAALADKLRQLLL